MINNALIMGNVYGPDTDCQYVLLRVTAKEWDNHKKREMEEEDGN